MRASWLCVSWSLGVLIGVSPLGCGSEVATVNNSSAGSSSSGAASSSSSGGASCKGDEIRCVTSCAVVDAPVPGECIDGSWTCPSGTLNEAQCFDDPDCPGALAACDVCAADGSVQCDVSKDCLANCPAVACSSCTSGGLTVNGCSCSCSSDGQLKCATQTCCMSDIDCGDKVYFPCVNGVCKQPVLDGCWSTSECGPGTSCIDAFVCPCGESCDTEDVPGYCEGPGP